MHGGPSDLHLIHGWGQKLSILRLTPYKQSVEETKESPVRSSGERERDLFFSVVRDQHFSAESKGKTNIFQRVSPKQRLERDRHFSAVRNRHFSAEENCRVQREDRHFEWSDRDVECCENDLLNLAGSIRTKRWK